MKTWSAPIFNNNHKKLMWFHLVLALPMSFIGSAIAAGVAVTFVQRRTHIDYDILMLAIWPAFFCLMLIAHALLACGCAARVELARKISEYYGAILLFGFPIGTLLGYFFVQTTLWCDPEVYKDQIPQ